MTRKRSGALLRSVHHERRRGTVIDRGAGDDDLRDVLGRGDVEHDRTEHVLEDRAQPAGDRLGRFVRPAREDDLVELFSLFADRGHDARVGVAVGGDPPAGNGVDPAAAIGVVKARTVAAGDQRDQIA